MTAPDIRSVYGFAVESSPITAALRPGTGDALTVVHRPELAVGPTEETREVVRWEARPGVVFHGSVHEASDGSLYIETSDAGWFHLDPAIPAIAYSGDAADVAVQVRTWITPMLLLMTRRGRLPLHAAAVSTEQGVVAIGAPGKHGKTTLVAALHAAGCSLYAEDITCVEGRMVLAGPGLIRLRPDAEGRFDQGRLTELGRTDERTFLHDPSPQPEPAPLRAVILLRQGAEPALELRSGPELLADLWALSFHLPTTEDRARAFAGLSGLASEVELYDLTRPLDWSTFHRSVSLVLERFGGPA
jgi:hypothetical protein